MNPLRKFYPLNSGGEISALHYGDMSRPADLVFLHATGFNALAYKTLLGPLADEGLHIIALDMRGHGMSRLPAEAEALQDWYILRDDILEFLDRYLDAPVVIAGHSCGAVVSFLTAAKAGSKVRGLVAFDPVSLPVLPRLFMKTKFGREWSKKRFSLARNAGKRRAVFETKQAVFERYKGRGTFKHTGDAIVRDYIDGGFVETQNGVELTCTPAWEQAIFVSQGHNVFRAARAAPKNSRCIYAIKYSPSTPGTRLKMKLVLGGGKVDVLKGSRHFFPLEDQDYARDILRGVLKS